MQTFRFLVQLGLVIALLSGCPPDDDEPMTVDDAGVDAADAADADSSIPDMGGEDSDRDCVAMGCPDDRVCDDSSGECVGCLDAADCTDPTAPVCRQNTCTGCESDDDCTDAATSYCAADGSCVACTSDEHCTDETPFCDESNTCVRCTASSDCPTTAPACAGGTCQTCSDVECSPEEQLRAVAGEFCRNGIKLEGRYDDLRQIERSTQAAQAVMCTGDFSLDPTYEMLFDAIEDGRVAIDEDALEACHMSEERESCAATDLLVPQVADGEACLADLECVSGVCDETTCPGTCAARGDVGDGCMGDGDCRTSLTCIAESCSELPALGEVCETKCAEGWCDQGTCLERRSVDEPCTDGTECESFLCDRDTQVCLAIPGPGDDCVGFECQDGGRCWEDTCQEPQPVGSACDVTAQCARGLRCVEQSCVQILLPGEPCTDTDHCARGTGCIDGRCRPLPDVGEACERPTGCLRGICEDGTCVNQAAGETCPVNTYPSDLFDPCGDVATCVDTDGRQECVTDLSQGQACGGSVSAVCSTGTSCQRDENDDLVCQELCSIDEL